ncbi:MAG: hypothetical protein PUE00_02480, partial [Thermobifida fusca]|nr:hypothetical protein [Thermobifida fusca]
TPYPPTPGSFSSYDTGTQPRTDYNTPPSAPSGTPYQSYDVLGDYPQSPPSPAGYGEPGYDRPQEWPPARPDGRFDDRPDGYPYR